MCLYASIQYSKYMCINILRGECGTWDQTMSAPEEYMAYGYNWYAAFNRRRKPEKMEPLSICLLYTVKSLPLVIFGRINHLKTMHIHYYPSDLSIYYSDCIPPPPTPSPLPPPPLSSRTLSFVSMFVFVLGLDPIGYPV
jgi:hypothetical protein